MFFNSSINKEVVISLNKDVLTLSGLLVAFEFALLHYCLLHITNQYQKQKI